MNLRFIFHASAALLSLHLAALAADEPDILDVALKNPLNITTSAGRPKYGDPDLDKAVEALADIPHPWTVPQFIELYEQGPWPILHPNGVTIPAGFGDWEKIQRRKSHLITLLASSRDPRAAPVLMKAMDFPSTWIKSSASRGLYYYFVFDTRYIQLSPDPRQEGSMYTNFIPERNRRVRDWWELNKAKLAPSAREQEPAAPPAR